MRKLRDVLTVVMLLGMTAAAALAQQGLTELRGRVTDEQGGALPGVAILITNQDTGTFREVVTSGDGSFFAAQLLPGTFTVSAELPGFAPYERTDFPLGVGRTTDLDIVLTVGGIEESITVSGAAPLVDLTSAEVGGTVSSDELVELPLVNRSAFAAISLLPGLQFDPQGGGNDRIIANGQTGAASSLNVDGGANEDSTSGGSGGSQVKMAIETVSEFQVISNQFDAEFGRASGAIINAVTKRGTNSLSGALFSYNTSSDMTAKDYFTDQEGSDKPVANKFEFGGVLGGPIVEDRMHFFGAVERRITNPARTRLFSTRPDLNRTSTERLRAWNTMLRVDHQINGNNSWAVRWLRETSPEQDTLGSSNRTLVATQDIFDVEQIMVGTYTSVFGNNLVNTVRVTLTDESYNYGNPCWRTFQGGELRTGQMRNCPPSYLHNSFRDNQAPWAGGRDDRHWQYNNTTSWFVPDKAGDHDFKFGVTYHQSYIGDFLENFLGGEFRMASDRPFDVDDLTTYPDRLRVRIGNPRGGVFDYPYRYWEAFFQDKWTLNERWTLGLGLRYDTEMMNANRTDNPLMAPGENPRDWDNFSPRTSIAYDATGDGRSVIRAGYGRFYDRTLFSGLDNVLQDTVIDDSFDVTFPRNFNRDPGPRAGMPITDPELMGALRIGQGAECGPANQRDGNTHCPLVNWDYVLANFPETFSSLNEARTYIDNERRNQPWFHQFTVGYERELLPTLSVSADYVNMRGRDLLNRINYIAPLRAGTSDSDPLTWYDAFGEIYNRTDTAFYPSCPGAATSGLGSPTLVGKINDACAMADASGFGPAGYLVGVFQNRLLSIESIGQSSYDGLNFALEKRYADRWGGRVSYALGHSRGNAFEQYGTNGPSLNGLQTQVLNNLNLDENWQDSETDRRHILSLAGRTELWGGITLNAIFRYMSELPFTLIDSNIDVNMNGSPFDPLPAGSYSGEGLNAITVDHNGRQAGARSADFMQLDLRFGWRGRPRTAQTVDIYFDIVNLTNRANFNRAVGDRDSGDFLNYTGLRGPGGLPRQAIFGMRYGF